MSETQLIYAFKLLALDLYTFISGGPSIFLGRLVFFPFLRPRNRILWSDGSKTDLCFEYHVGRTVDRAELVSSNPRGGCDCCQRCFKQALRSLQHFKKMSEILFSFGIIGVVD